MVVHLTHLCYIRSLDEIPASILPHFKEAAQDLIKERGAEDALAAALAHISGSKEIVSRSVLSGMSVRILTPLLCIYGCTRTCTYICMYM